MNLPETVKDLWLAECCIGPDGVAVFHVAPLGEAVEMNAIQLARGWSAGYVPFAVCETLDAAHAACAAMRQVQQSWAGVTR